MIVHEIHHTDKTETQIESNEARIYREKKFEIEKYKKRGIVTKIYIFFPIFWNIIARI